MSMAELLGEILYETGAQGPPPLKDYFSFKVTKTQVIWRWWKISLRLDSRHAKPGEVRESHSEYLEDQRLQSQVATVFGDGVLQHSRNLCEGRYDFLPRLPTPLLLRITAHLQLEDVAHLALTCHRFNQLCSSEDFWEQTVRLHCDTVTPGMEELAREVGWRNMFFTDKLQLQKHISRRRVKGHTAQQAEDPSCNTTTP